MKKQAIIILSLGTLLAILGAYFAIFNAESHQNIPWWSFLLFFIGVLLIPIGFAFYKVKKPRIHKEEEASVVIVPFDKKNKD